MMSEKKRFEFYSDDYLVGIIDTVTGKKLNHFATIDLLNELHEESDVLKQQLQTKYVVNKQYEEIQRLKKENEDLREVNKENKLLHEENVKQCERWKNLYELKDAEVTARVDALNRVCNYYITEVQFIADTDPNEAVKEVINEILNAPIMRSD